MNITLHPGQSEVFKDQFVHGIVMHAVIAASRGWGKSAFASAASIKACHELMTLDASVPNKNVVLIAPTFTSVGDIYWALLMYVFGLQSIALPSSRGTSKALGRIVLPRNVELKLVSAEAIERQRGGGIYYAVGDEIDTWTIKKPVDAWDSVIHAAGRTRWSEEMAAIYGAPSAFRSTVISSPKGCRSLYTLYNRTSEDEEYGSYHFDYTQSPYVSAKEVEKARRTMDIVTFAQEYKASFDESGPRVYHAYDRELNVLENNAELNAAFLALSAEERGAFRCGIDFNVGINATCVGHLFENCIIVTNDHSGAPNTEELAVFLKNTYGKCLTYPDPTGNSRKTAAPVGQTDFTELKKYGHVVFARMSSPSIVDSVKAVNRLLCDANGTRRLFISRKAKKLRDSLLRTQWVEGRPDTAMIDKSEGVEHWSDGLRYMVEYLFPVKTKPSATRGFNF